MAKDEAVDKVVEEVIPEVVEEILEQVTEPDVSPEVEEKAKKMGWTPREEFKGDPDKWRPANEFVERGETMLPIMKKTVEKQEKKIAELERSAKEISEYITKTEQRAYEKAVRDLKAKQIQAVSEGDTNAFVAIDKEIGELQADAASIPVAKSNDNAFKSWEQDNKWLSDETMKTYAEGLAMSLGKRTDISYSEKLEEVTKAVKKAFPDKFTNPRRESAPSVEGTSSVQKRGGKTYSDLPLDARAACDRAVKNYGIKKENWVSTYYKED